jgi:hypothetical protein
MEAIATELGFLTLLESVRCLECGEVYSKPVEGGTVQTNPGCPICEYVGWIPIRLPREPRLLHRPGGGRPRPRSAPTG